MSDMFKLQDREKVQICPSIWCPPIRSQKKFNDAGNDMANELAMSNEVADKAATCIKKSKISNDELSEDERNNIIEMKSTFIANARPDNYITPLYKHLFITPEQKQELQSFVTRKRKSEYIFQHVLMNVFKYSQVRELQQIFTRCKPEGLAALLPDRDKMYESRNAAISNFVDEDDKRMIQMMYEEWIDYADPKFLVPKLIAAKLLDQTQKEIINSKMTNIDKNSYIHDNVLMVATYSEMCTIREILSKCKKHKHFTKLLPCKDSNANCYNDNNDNNNLENVSHKIQQALQEALQEKSIHHVMFDISVVSVSGRKTTQSYRVYKSEKSSPMSYHQLEEPISEDILRQWRLTIQVVYTTVTMHASTGGRSMFSRTTTMGCDCVALS